MDAMATKAKPNRIVTARQVTPGKDIAALMEKGLEHHGYVTLMIATQVYDPIAQRYVTLKGQGIKVKCFSVEDAMQALEGMEAAL